MSMETKAINVDQSFGLSAYRGRLAMELLSCVNNRQSRCDILDDANAILGCAACCSGLESTSDGLPLDKHLQKNYLHTNMLENAVNGQPFFSCLHSPSINNNNPFLESNFFNEQLASDVHAKRLRKRAAVFPEEETVNKKGRSNYLESLPNLPNTILVSGVPAQPQGDKEKLKAAKPRKGKVSLPLIKVEDGNHVSKPPEPTIREEPEPKTAPLERQRCILLLRSYGIIGNPIIGIRETLNRCVPHPGHVGDGLLTKMCKICGMAEDASNTVICDGCQETFHLSCCAPRLTSKYFKREDNWFCALCRRGRKKIGRKFAEKGSNQDNKSNNVTKCNEPKARLGPAYQAEVPEWQKRGLNDDAERCIEGCLGMEMSLTKEQKDAERDHLLRSFNAKVESLCWLPADKIPPGVPQNWVKCNNVIVRGYKTSDGRKQSDIVCGKWRRAPLNVEQRDEWECFCAMEWDPLHADCAISQECSDEEIESRIVHQLQINKDLQSFEADGRKSTIRHGKLVV